METAKLSTREVSVETLKESLEKMPDTVLTQYLQHLIFLMNHHGFKVLFYQEFQGDWAMIEIEDIQSGSVPLEHIDKIEIVREKE